MGKQTVATKNKLSEEQSETTHYCLQIAAGGAILWWLVHELFFILSSDKKGFVKDGVYLIIFLSLYKYAI